MRSCRLETQKMTNMYALTRQTRTAPSSFMSDRTLVTDDNKLSPYF